MEVKESFVKALKRACAIFVQDLEALPEEAFSRSFGPKVRTVADIVFEVNLVNGDISKKLRGETTPDWPDEGWIKAPEDFQSKEAVIQGFKTVSDDAIATAESFSEEQMDTKMKTENGETTVAERIRFMTLHIWYHSGQLNFIQTLLGDDGWHWS